MGEKEAKIYKTIKEYFQETDPKSRQPSSWRVPIGASFYDEKEINAVLECYFKGLLSVQKKVVEFEKAFSQYIGTKYGVATNSGTSAIILALGALLETGELQRGDEIILPATTFISDANVPLQLGLIPVYVDVETETLNLDPSEVEKAIGPKTKAIMVVHTLGRPADMDRIMEIAGRHHLKVIEDCCEAHGAAYKGKKVGQFGDLAVFSFYVAHNMTTGEGGMVLTNSDTYYPIVAELREFGRFKSYQGPRYGYSDAHLTNYDERYVFHRIGYNFRMADPPAAFGIEQLKRLDELNKRRVEYAKFYIHNFPAKLNKLFHLPSLYEPEIVHAFYGFPFAIKQGANIPRAELTRYLESQGVETRAILCGTLPDQPSLQNAPGRISGNLPVSRWIRDSAFFVGCHPALKEDDLKYVIDKIEAFCSSRKG